MKYFLIVLFSFQLIAQSEVKTLDWDGLNVVWIEDNSVPTFSVQVYFSDGALSDSNNRAGETDMMFSMLFSGTNRFSQEQIHDSLEFFGVNYSTEVFHEYSTLSFGGLNKDMVPVAKKFCHLFKDSIFPARELKKEKKRLTSYLKNIEASHSKLANRVFRRLSLRGSDFELPTEGTLKTIKRLKTGHLVRKKRYFNEKVGKKIYLRGNSQVLSLKDIFIGECGFNKKQNFVRKVSNRQKIKKLKTRIVLVPVKKSNQAQIRIGRFLRADEIQDPDLLALTSGYLGGGFTSVLTQEIRVKRGLTYTINAVASGQKHYGRSFVMTFSRNDKVKETLQVLKKIFNEKSDVKNVPFDDLKKSVAYLQGHHLFQFEKNDSFLRNLMFYDHIGRDWKELYDFPNRIDRYTQDELASTIKNVFGWDDSVIIVVGDKSLLKELAEIDTTQVLPYKRYL